jgi:radical SAM protein with 4Fe4S-binding SPASM domain
MGDPMIKYTDLKSTARHDLKECLPLAKPFTVLVEPTSHCNFRCIQCFQSLDEPSGFKARRMHMPLTRFRKVMDQLQSWPGEKHKVLKLSLYGEPLLSPDFSEMLHLAREADVSERIETTTNASLLTASVAEAMVRDQLDYVRVSIYSADPEGHRAITGSHTSVGRILENLRGLQEAKQAAGSPRPFVSCKMLDAYGPENDRFLATFAPVADEVYIDKPHGWIQVDGADFIGTYYEDGARRVRQDLDVNSTDRVACPMAFTTMAVRCTGDVSPCCVDFVGGTDLGTIEELELRQIWTSDAWYQFQVMQLQGRRQENVSCARCDVVRSDHYTLDDIDGFPVERLR